MNMAGSNKCMKWLDKIKELTKKLPKLGKKGFMIGGGILVAFAIVLALLLNTGSKKKSGYKVLFSGLSEQESTEVMSKLQEEGIEYQYSQDGKIKVPEKLADKTRATLALEGYPKNGFTYETYLNNSNMMSTESDKKSLKVWEMQDRLGATIRSINGVKDAVVQIVPGETQKYVIGDSEENTPTASVMVTMQDGSSPTPEQVAGIQRLVAKAVANMDIGDVAVIDSNGIDVSQKKNDEETPATDKKIKFEKEVEAQIENKVLNVLEVLWGRNNIRVSVKCQADMQKVISEENGYTAPNQQDNLGYINHQEIHTEGQGANGAGGVPGAGTNTNVPQYNTNPGATQNSSSYSSNTDYALNQKKVQSQDEGGKITDLSVAVSINSDTLDVSRQELTSMIARAAGIDPAVQDQKIVVVNKSWYSNVPEDEKQDVAKTSSTGSHIAKVRKYLPFIIIGAVIFIVLLVVIIVLIIRRKRKKKRLAEEEANAILPFMPELEELPIKIEKPQVEEQNKEMRDTIREFTDENPEISAQLLKNWLGGEDNSGK